MKHFRAGTHLNNPSHPTGPYDQSSGTVTFNAATRAFSMVNNTSISLSGGI